MRRMVAGILGQYGTPMTVERNGAITSVKGFFQPVRSKSWQSLVHLDTPMGEIPRAQYIYIGPPEVAVQDGDVVNVGDKAYWIRRTEEYDYCGETLYIWGLCIEKGVDNTWSSQS